MDLILSYCHHSLNDKSLRDLLPLLREKGVGVVNGSVLSMGLLTNKARCTGCMDCPAHCMATADRVRFPNIVNISTAEGAQCATLINISAASCWHPMIHESCLVYHSHFTVMRNNACDAFVQGPPDWHPAPQEVKEAAARAAKHCRDAGVDIAKLAIMDTVRAEDIPTNLVGCASRDQVRVCECCRDAC